MGFSSYDDFINLVTNSGQIGCVSWQKMLGANGAFTSGRWYNMGYFQGSPMVSRYGERLLNGSGQLIGSSAGWTGVSGAYKPAGKIDGVTYFKHESKEFYLLQWWNTYDCHKTLWVISTTLSFPTPCDGLAVNASGNLAGTYDVLNAFPGLQGSVIIVSYRTASSSSSSSSESSSSSFNAKKFRAEKDRFTGYNLPTIRLDDGFDYYYVAPHPTLLNQPSMWQQAAFQVGFDTAGGNVTPLLSEAPRGTSPAPPRGRSDIESPMLPL